MVYASLLQTGDTIGIISPSHIAGEADYRKIAQAIESIGFCVKLGGSIFKSTYGYLASEQERADDLNSMVNDETVKMIIFGGGWGASEILPLIDYENIKCHPKLFSSYSDGTSILNAIHAKTDLVTYYGLGAGEFRDLRHYEYTQFAAHFIQGNRADSLRGNGNWRVVRPGECAGILAGGYVQNFCLHLDGEYFKYYPQKKYILFLEDHEKYNSVAGVSVYLSHIEQSAFIKCISGLVFGHYSDNVPDDLLRRFERFGEKHNIPVIYCDDFGHGLRHSILPIGVETRLDTDAQVLAFERRSDVFAAGENTEGGKYHA